MSDADNRNPQQPHPDQGWQPLPQGGEYESEATAFVQLPEGFTTGVYGRRTPGYTPGADPLAAPGHGYTPPASFTSHAATQPAPGTGADPAATGQWTMPFADHSAGYADPSAGYAGQVDTAAHQGALPDYRAGAPEAAQHWGGEPVDWPVAGSPEAGGTGSWSVPAAADDGLEESGEYLVGDDRLTGHTGIPGRTGGHTGLPGQHGHPGHAGHQALTDPAAYQGGGYPDAGAYDAADPGETARTGHWNFTAGLSATSDPHAPVTGAQEASRGGAAPETFGGSAGDPYARGSGLADHHHTGTVSGRGAGPEGEPSGDAGVPAGDPYGTGAGGLDAAAGAATGHWALPADALAQWPPATGAAPADRQDGAADVPAPAGAGGWTSAADGTEQRHGSDEFTPGDDATAEPAESASSASVNPGAPDTSDEPTDHERTGPVDATDLHAAAEATGNTAPAGAATPEGADDDGSTAPTDPEPTGADAPAGPADRAAASDPAADTGTAEPADTHDEHPAASYVLRVNGIDRPVTDAWIGESLLYVLRERLGLAGAKDGCSQGECGACSVQVDGRLVASCLVPAATTAGSEVRTVEGLAQNGVPSDVQRALAESGAVQCGFCVPGMAMTVHDLLEGNHAPSELETRKALCGNLCRCSGYRGVLDAVEEVVKARAEAAEAAYAPADAPPDAPVDAAPDDPAEAAPADTARIPHQAGPADPMGHAPHHQDPHTGGPA